MLLDEAKIVEVRENNRHATEATLIQMAVLGVLTKEGNKDFRETVKELTGKIEWRGKT